MDWAGRLLFFLWRLPKFFSSYSLMCSEVHPRVLTQVLLCSFQYYIIVMVSRSQLGKLSGNTGAPFVDVLSSVRFRQIIFWTVSQADQNFYSHLPQQSINSFHLKDMYLKTKVYIVAKNIKMQRLHYPNVINKSLNNIKQWSFFSSFFSLHTNVLCFLYFGQVHTCLNLNPNVSRSL